MKRDARIGMAVVLVLGLSVTVLVARSLYKNGSGAELEGETAADASTTAKKADTDPTFSIPGSPATPEKQLETTPPLADGGETANPPTPQPTAPVNGNGPQQPVPHNPGEVQTPPAVAASFYSYTVTSGDSPWKIAAKLFGDGKYTQKIVDANGGGNLTMKPGAVIKIPAIANRPLLVKLQPFGDKVHAPVAANATLGHEEDHTGKTPYKGSIYKIARGDTLALIAKKTYGSNGPATIEKIVAANKGLDPARLQVGQEIKLPAK